MGLDGGDALIILMVGIFVGIPLSILVVRGVRRHMNIDYKDPFRRRARLHAYLFHTTRWGIWLDLFQVFLSLFACGCYIYETYDDEISKESWWESLELAVGVIFGTDYIFRFYIAKDRLTYYFEPLALIDMITVMPTIVYAALLIEANNNVSFLRVLRLLRALRVLRVLKIMRLFAGDGGSGGSTSVIKAVAKVAFTALCMIFSCACFFALVEEIPFHVAFYFMCIEALGRPPIPILTISGFFLVYTLVVLSVILLPKQIADLISIWAADKSKRKEFKKDPLEDHIMMCGFIQYSSAKDFLNDMFQEVAFICKVCIMTATSPPPNLIGMLTMPPYSDYVKLCEGSVMDKGDLGRVLAPGAKEVFVFCQVHCKNRVMEDHITCTRVISLQHCCTVSKVRCMVLLPRTRDIIVNLASWKKSDVVICLQVLKLSLMALNCICPGSITLLSSMYSSPLKLKMTAKEEAELPQWKKDYFTSRINSLYQLLLPGSMIGLPFRLACSYMYEAHDIILIGILEPDAPECCDLNPQNHIIVEGDIGVVLASGSRALDKIEEQTELYELILKEQGRDAALARVSATEVHSRATQIIDEGNPLDIISLTGKNHPKEDIAAGEGVVSVELVDISAPKEENGEELSVVGSNRSALLNSLLQTHYGGDLNALVEDAKHARDGGGSTVMAKVGEVGVTTGRRLVLLCGFISSMALCLRLLCEGGFDIVILSPEEPTEELASVADAEVCRGRVRHVAGSALSLVDLERAGLHKAHHAIVFSKETFLQTGTAVIDELVQDTDALLIYKLIKAHAEECVVTTELVDSCHIVFMEDNTAESGGSTSGEECMSCRAFASGEVYTAMLASILMSKLHILPCAAAVLEHLTTPHDTDGEGMRMVLGDIPEEFVGSPFSELFQHILETRGVVPLGLQRFDQIDGMPDNIVLAKPSPTLRVGEFDKLYMLC